MWNNLEHHIWKKLKKHGLDQCSQYLVAVSGGADSLAAALMIKRLKPQSQIIVMHFHHGDEQSASSFRDRALNLTQKFCEQNDFEFVFEKSNKTLNSEADFRQARNQFFQSCMQRFQVRFYITGHHLDDVLETRLIKMIRGTGIEGLASYQEWNSQVLRLFFDTSKEEILDYIQDMKIDWIEDPSNEETDYFRNWIRNKWLPDLEKIREGSVKSLAQSFQNITDFAQAFQESQNLRLESSRYIIIGQNNLQMDRSWFQTLDVKLQTIVLSRVLKEEVKVQFSTSQINEILKKLDKNQNDHIFRVAKLNWLITKEKIVIQF